MLPRRTFLASGAILLAAPCVAGAQQFGPTRRVGILAQDLQPGLLEAFVDELRKLGYEGVNISIEMRNAEGHNERLPAMAKDLLLRHVEVILAVNTPAAKAAQAATATVPVVMMRVADPVNSKLVASLAHPGGNITGLFFMLDEFGAKGLELLREVAPRISRIGILYQADNPALPLVAAATERRGTALRMNFLRLPVLATSDLASAFETASAARTEALFVIDDGAMTERRHEVVDRATRRLLPIVSIYKDFAEAGGLIAYGPNLDVFYRRGAHYVDKVLKGVAPADLPVEQPTKYDLIINTKAAKALGITVPPVVLLRADEVIG